MGHLYKTNEIDEIMNWKDGTTHLKAMTLDISYVIVNGSIRIPESELFNIEEQEFLKGRIEELEKEQQKTIDLLKEVYKVLKQKSL